MAKRDYYQVLELSKNASEEEIKKAYRKKAI
ncbi:MAG: DnaJ domain-containing protein, partial [Bacteroidales bacterium]